MIKTKKKNLLLTVGSILASLMLVFGLVLIGANIKTNSNVRKTNTVFADPVMATSGYCGDTSVNNGENVQWEISNHVLRIWCPYGPAAMGDGEGSVGQTAGNQYFWYGDNSEKITMVSFYSDFINSINSVVVESGVTVIGDNAFCGFELTSISLPETITEIKAGAFSQSNIDSVTIPDSVTKLGDEVFIGSTINKIHLGKNVRQFGDGDGDNVFFGINKAGSSDVEFTKAVDIYLKVKYSDFESESEVTTYLWSFALSLCKPSGDVTGEKSDFVYVENGVAGDQVDYGEPFNWNHWNPQKANIHYDSSLNEYFADVFADADSDMITITQNVVPQTGIALNLSITIGSVLLLGAVLVVMSKKKEQY